MEEKCTFYSGILGKHKILKKKNNRQMFAGHVELCDSTDAIPTFFSWHQKTMIMKTFSKVMQNLCLQAVFMLSGLVSAKGQTL